MADETIEHPLIGAEPEVAPPPGEAPSSSPPPVPPAEEPPAEVAPPEGEQPPVEAAEGEAEAEGEEQPPEKPPGVKKPHWRSELRAAKREMEEYKRRLAEYEARETEREARFAEAQRAFTGQEKPTQWQPEHLRQGRIPTQADLDRLEQEDPLAHSQVLGVLARMEAQQARAEAQQVQYQNAVRNQIDEFRRTTPDYDDALHYLEERETTRLQAAGVPTIDTAHQPDPNGICCVQHGLQARSGMLIAVAMKQGKSIPQMAYEVAKADGWTGKPPAAAEPAAPAAPEKATPLQKVQAAKAKSEAAAGSLGNIPTGTARKGPLSRQDILSMTEADLDRLDAELGEGWHNQVIP